MNFIFDPSLVLYLPLYGLDGSSFASREAYGHTCTVIGALWRPNYRHFDGTDDKISVAAHDILKFSDSFTVEAWVNLDSSLPAQHHTTVSIGGAANRITCSARRNAAGNYVAIYNTATPGWHSSTTSLSAGEFHQVVWVIKASSHVSFFFNGDFVEQSSNGAFPTFDGTVTVGFSLAGTEYFKGCIGEVRVYNRGLTAQEIQHNYMMTKWRYR